MEDWTGQFEGLEQLAPDLRRELVAGSSVTEYKAGTIIFGPGQKPDNLLLMLSGTVLVQQHSDTGRDITLFRVSAGESCVMTASCILAMEDYSAEGVAETDVRAVAIPRRLFDDMLGKSASFRQYVFATYARRITDLFLLIDEVVFRRLDVRLAARLLALARKDSVTATHQALSVELGTAREVVSRTLQDFQRRGWIEQSRGEIRLQDTDALRRLAAA